MKKDLCISPRNGRTKIISDKLVTCICDVVKKTALKRLESCIILGLKSKNCFACDLLHMYHLFALRVQKLLTFEEQERTVIV